MGRTIARSDKQASHQVINATTPMHNWIVTLAPACASYPWADSQATTVCPLLYSELVPAAQAANVRLFVASCLPPRAASSDKGWLHQPR